MGEFKTYFFVDVNLITKQVLCHGESNSATHDGETGDPAVHRVFISKGQYNKLVARLSEFDRSRVSE